MTDNFDLAGLGIVGTVLPATFVTSRSLTTESGK